MMYTKSRSFFLLLILLSASFTHAKEEEKKQTIQEEITEYIYHHVQDSHDFSLFSTKDKETGKKKYYGFPLPVILIDDGIKFFMSSKLDHGKKVVESSGKFYKLDHGKIYETNSEGYISYNDAGKITNAMPLDLSITKSVFSSLLVAILMFFLFTSLAKSYKENNLIARGAGRFFEPIVILIRDEIAIPSIGEEKHKRYMAFLLTVFFFIWFLNLLGLSPLGVNVTGNIAVTFGLALITFLITHLTANNAAKAIPSTRAAITIAATRILLEASGCLPMASIAPRPIRPIPIPVPMSTSPAPTILGISIFIYLSYTFI